MKIAILPLPGTLCEPETVSALERVGMEPIIVAWGESMAELSEMAGYLLTGTLLQPSRFEVDTVMHVIAQEAEKGKPVLGISSGAQVLVEMGLVPGLENNKPAIMLTNAEQGILPNTFVNIRLAQPYQRNAFTRNIMPDMILRFPLPAAAGRFVMSQALLQEIEEQGLGVFKYCDEAGVMSDEAVVNPYDSVHHIAAISNKAGNVMAMVPNPTLIPEGDTLLSSMRRYIEKGVFVPVLPLNYYPRK